MPNLMLDLIVDRVDLVDEGANSEAFIKLYKRKENEQTMELEEILAKMKPEHAAVIRDEIAKAKANKPDGDPEDKKDGGADEDMENMKGELEKAKSDFKAAFDENEVLKRRITELETADIAKKKDEDFEEILKSADPAVQAVFKSIQAQKQAAEEAVRQLNEKSKHEEAVAKAKELKNLPVDEDKLVEVIKSASTEIVEILKAANAALDNGELFSEVGKSRTDTGATSDANAAWAKIEKKACEIEKRDSVTHQKAVATAIRENPALYQEYLAGGAN